MSEQGGGGGEDFEMPFPVTPPPPRNFFERPAPMGTTKLFYPQKQKESKEFRSASSAVSAAALIRCHHFEYFRPNAFKLSGALVYS